VPADADAALAMQPAFPLALPRVLKHVRATRYRDGGRLRTESTA
jgi:hypothetical protein